MATEQLTRSLILVTGEEGVGKSTLMSALLAHTPGGAKVDAEDVGQVNPFEFGPDFLDMLWRNVASVIGNFWDAGYATVITGSLLDGDTYDSFRQFRQYLPSSVSIQIVHLHASKPERDRRRIRREKPSSKEWRDRVDAAYPPDDTSLRDHATDYGYIAIDNTALELDETLARVFAALPDLYPAPGSTRPGSGTHLK